MGVLGALGRWLGGGGGRPPAAFTLHARCGRCGEVIAVRIEPRIQAGADYAGGEHRYVLRKVIAGNRCPQRMELTITYDERYREQSRTLTGGEVVDGPGRS
ncbi:MAG TPA: hypothetical protein VFK80_06880 [Limnochordia bacterium]|nr:hypothetical protein [Limnochordia bacterium]